MHYGDGLSVEGGRLHFYGVDLIGLADGYGTPLFVFSEERIRRNVEEVADAFGRENVFYACKANSNLAILRIIRGLGVNVEVTSDGELFKALKAGFRPEQVVFNGVAKTVGELRMAVEYGVHCVNLDSLYELRRLRDVVRDFGGEVNVAFRVASGVLAGTHVGFETATPSSKFGITLDEMEEAYREAFKGDGVNPIGVHCHVASQVPRVEVFEEGVRRVSREARRVERKVGFEMLEFNMGGGFPIPYAKMPVKELPEYFYAQLDVHEVALRVKRVVRENLENARLIVEPGRRIVGDSAVLLTQVQNVKERNGEKWLLIDSGFNVLLDAFSYKWYFHVVSASRAGEEHREPYVIGGPLCDGGDALLDPRGALPRYRFLPHGVKPGEYLAILDVGAYTLEQMSQYNGRPRPAAVLLSGSSVKLIRRRENFDDLIRNDMV